VLFLIQKYVTKTDAAEEYFPTFKFDHELSASGCKDTFCEDIPWIFFELVGLVDWGDY